jgi:hypothetical protein
MRSDALCPMGHCSDALATYGTELLLLLANSAIV